MSNIFEYLLYAVGLIALVFGVEGLVRLVRSNFGEERAIGRRFAKARAQSTATAEARTPSSDALQRAIGARLPWLGRALARADAPFDALQVLVVSCALFIGVFLGARLIHAPLPLALAAAVAIGAGVPATVLSSLANRRRKRFLDQLPQAVDLIARSLQAGHPVTTAMTVVGQRMEKPLGPEFRLAVEEMTYGLDRDEALDNLVHRFPLPELQMFVACLEVTRETGGNLAEVFLKLSEAIRAKDHLRRKVHAISAEGRLTFWVVTGLPFVVGGLLVALRPSFFADVAPDPLFWPMMSFAPVSLAIGSAMIWRMVNLKI